MTKTKQPKCVICENRSNLVVLNKNIFCFNCIEKAIIKYMEPTEKIIIKEFGKDFHSEGGALTLKTSEVTECDEEDGYHTRTHPDGWTIEGEIHEDYYVWVNNFKASHPKLGKVWGNFENDVDVYATSEEAFNDFFKKHPPEAWNYQDI